MSRVRNDLAARPRGTRSVVAAHAFVMGGLASDSERDISVGGVSVVSSSVFAGIDYVALGHLHGRQQVTPAMRYSGSPLAYSFSEHAHTKGAWLITLDEGGVAGVEAVDAPVPRRLAVLRGTLANLLGDAALAPHENAWCQVTLTDAQRPAEAMQRLRARFPHTLELRLRPDGVPATAGGTYLERVTGRDDVEICCGFVEHVRGRPADATEVTWLREAITAGRLVAVEEQGVAVERAVARESAATAAITARQEVAAAEALTLLDLPATVRRHPVRSVSAAAGPPAAPPPGQQLSLEDVG